MPSTPRILVLPLSALAVTACSAMKRLSPSDSKAPKAGSTASQTDPAEAAVHYHGAIEPLLARSCLACHGSQAVASPPLSTYGEVRQVADKVVAAVVLGRMPPWLATPGHQTYKDDPSLTPEEKERFAAWKRQGFPEGAPPASPVEPPGAPPEELPASVTLSPTGSAEPYVPSPDEPNEYRCFILPWDPGETTRYVTAVQMRPGRREIVHHMTLFTAPAELLPTLRQLEEDDPGRGYLCNGSATPSSLARPEVAQKVDGEAPGMSRRLIDDITWVYHWAPGMQRVQLPEGTGIPLRPGSALIMQLHFHTQHHPGIGEDGGVVRLQLAERVERPAMVLSLSDDRWYAGRDNQSLVIPPFSTVSVQAEATLETILATASRLLGVARPERLELHAVNLHMHARGQSATTWLTDAQGQGEVLLDIQRYDYQAQRDYVFQTPKTFAAQDLGGRRMGIRCTYANPAATPVYGGLGSDEEMCINFFFAAVAPAGEAAR